MNEIRLAQQEAGYTDNNASSCAHQVTGKRQFKVRLLSTMSFHRWSRFLSTVPWFIDKPRISQTFIPKTPIDPTIPDHAPQIIKLLHSQLLQSPHLDKSALSVGPAVPPPPGPPLPTILPHGRRNRGGNFSGESVYDMPDGGLWSWVVVAQVSCFSKRISVE